MEYISDLQLDELPQVKNLTTMDWDGMPLKLGGDGIACLDLGPDAASVLASIGFSLCWVDEESDFIMALGTDNDIVADWENGVFYDNFRGVWGSIDGNLVYMELSYEGDDYNLYSVPVLLNGEECYLQVVYDFELEEWTILGARQGVDESGMADKELRLLTVGDELTIIWYVASLSDDDDFEPYSGGELTVNADTAFSEMALPDGRYLMVFEMSDAMGGTAQSGSAVFDCEDGEIYTSV